MDIYFKVMKKFYKQITVNYLLNPEKWTRPKVNTERSQMNNTCRYGIVSLNTFDF